MLPILHVCCFNPHAIAVFNHKQILPRTRSSTQRRDGDASQHHHRNSLTTASSAHSPSTRLAEAMSAGSYRMSSRPGHSFGVHSLALLPLYLGLAHASPQLEPILSAGVGVGATAAINLPLSSGAVPGLTAGDALGGLLPSM